LLWLCMPIKYHAKAAEGDVKAGSGSGSDRLKASAAE